jgi:hypothetical protein
MTQLETAIKIFSRGFCITIYVRGQQRSFRAASANTHQVEKLFKVSILHYERENYLRQP